MYLMVKLMFHGSFPVSGWCIPAWVWHNAVPDSGIPVQDWSKTVSDYRKTVSDWSKEVPERSNPVQDCRKTVSDWSKTVSDWSKPRRGLCLVDSLKQNF